MKKHVNIFDYAGYICKALSNGGVLLTTKADGFVNTMTIGWGHVGIEWNRPIFIAYVRDSRLTHLLLEKNPEFTVNIPLEEVDKKILGLCGSRSGREGDKFSALNLHAEEGEQIQVPGILELPLTLECKVIYQQRQNPSVLSPALEQRFYPAVDETRFQDPHTAFYGEIISAYILEE